MTTSATELPPFSGDNPTCPKCGNAGAHTRYLTERQYMPYPSRARPYIEHLRRECTRCGHTWPEATIEQRPPTAPETTELRG
ncbi:hypothetical protein [Sphaerisporangium aureirubrum]|uniref:Zinc-ribbon domain-containing protein n=1 Tax=Sphaerisporangium aureirubrum TaxID=1544736 RepID=A0ABW1NDE8_9ACTN